MMMTNEVGKLLTAAEVAEMLHLHVNTVKRLGDRGELPFFRVCKRGDRRFRYDDVLDFLRRAQVARHFMPLRAHAGAAPSRQGALNDRRGANLSAVASCPAYSAADD